MKKVIFVAGPTAVGKTKYAIEIARAFHGEIISADSMQIYKYLDFGAPSPSKEELAQASIIRLTKSIPGMSFPRRNIRLWLKTTSTRCFKRE
jgi:tRNA dimethylallyltransferase